MDEDLQNNTIIENLDRSNQKQARPDLGLAGLPASSFDGKDFSGKRFRNNNFDSTMFENCNLTNADFTENNNLDSTEFVNCNVAGANFRGTNVKPEQFIYALNYDQAEYSNNEKMISQINKLRNAAEKGELNQDSIFYRMYRYFIRILGGNIIWTTSPPAGTTYSVAFKRDTNKVVDLAMTLNKK